MRIEAFHHPASDDFSGVSPCDDQAALRRQIVVRIGPELRKRAPRRGRIDIEAHVTHPSDGEFIELGQDAVEPVSGRQALAKLDFDVFHFKTPTMTISFRI